MYTFLNNNGQHSVQPALPAVGAVRFFCFRTHSAYRHIIEGYYYCCCVVVLGTAVNHVLRVLQFVGRSIKFIPPHPPTPANNRSGSICAATTYTMRVWTPSPKGWSATPLWSAFSCGGTTSDRLFDMHSFSSAQRQLLCVCVCLSAAVDAAAIAYLLATGSRLWLFFLFSRQKRTDTPNHSTNNAGIDITGVPGTVLYSLCLRLTIISH